MIGLGISGSLALTALRSERRIEEGIPECLFDWLVTRSSGFKTTRPQSRTWELFPKGYLHRAATLGHKYIPLQPFDRLGEV